MTDITYEAGIKALLQGFTGALTLDGELYAVLVSDDYTPDSTETDMTDVEAALWNGEFDSTANAIGSAEVLYYGTTTAQVDINLNETDRKVYIRCDDIEFGTITDTGSGTVNDAPGYVVIFFEENGTTAAGNAWPLACLKADFDATTEAYTFVVDTDGIVLWDPQ